MGRILALKHVRVLILGTCEYVTFCDRRDFADVTTLKILRWVDFSGSSRWAQCNHKGLYKREQEGQSQINLKMLLAL